MLFFGLLLLGAIAALLAGIPLAVIVYMIARRRGVGPWGWTIATLIPVAGVAVAALFGLLTLFSMLDRLNRLEQGQTFG